MDINSGIRDTSLGLANYITPIQSFTFFCQRLSLLLSFCLSIFSTDEILAEKKDSNIIDLLWKVFVTGLIATVVSLSSNFLLGLLSNNEHSRNPYFLDTLYLIHVGLIITFLISTFIVWKRLTLYSEKQMVGQVMESF